MYILGYDVGGTKITAILGNENGRIIDTVRMRTLREYGKEGLSNQLIEMGKNILNKNKVDHVDKIGIIFAGPVDSKNGVIISSPNIIGLKNFNVTKVLEDYFNVPVTLENDALASTIAEKLFGKAKNYDNFVYMTLSTGIGGGIFINGKLYKGSHEMAGELGHMVIMPNGPLCGCGRRGCFESIASGRGITMRVVEDIKALQDSTELSKIRPGSIDAKIVFEAKRKGDMLAQLIVEETIYYIAIGIVNVVNILDIDSIFIGGGLSKEGDNLFKPLRMAVNEEMKSFKRPIKIYKALENGADLGAIAVTLYEY